jgi:hypothetical protein
MARRLTVKLEGDEARLGRVRASDVAALIIGLERTVRRSSGQVLRRPVKATGRREKVIEAASEFRLVAVRRGSVVLELELPDLETDEDALALDLDVADLAEQGVVRAIDVLAGTISTTEGLAAEWAKLGDVLGIGTRFERLSLDLDSGSDVHRIATMDAPARDRLRAVAQREATQSRIDAVTGTLVEADFEARTAHLRTPTNDRVRVDFDEDAADAIQEALRRTAELVGEVTYEPSTNRVLSVRVRQITRAEQLAITLDDPAFWENRPISDLLSDQGVGSVRVDDLYDESVSDSEIDAFMSILAEM